MLAYLLSMVTGLGSLALYLAAFFFPAMHRQSDFVWSGLGMFYALVLWVYAEQETGGLLLGQLIAVALLGWFGWQTVRLRLLVDEQESTKTRSRLQELDQKDLPKDLPKAKAPAPKRPAPRPAPEAKPEAKIETALEAEFTAESEDPWES